MKIRLLSIICLTFFSSQPIKAEPLSKQEIIHNEVIHNDIVPTECSFIMNNTLLDSCNKFKVLFVRQDSGTELLLWLYDFSELAVAFVSSASYTIAPNGQRAYEIKGKFVHADYSEIFGYCFAEGENFRNIGCYEPLRGAGYTYQY